MFIDRPAYKKASTNLLLKAAFIFVISNGGDTKAHLVLHRVIIITLNILLGFACSNCSIQGTGTYFCFYKMPKLQIFRTGTV